MDESDRASEHEYHQMTPELIGALYDLADWYKTQLHELAVRHKSDYDDLATEQMRQLDRILIRFEKAR